MARTKGPNTQTSRANFDAYAKHSGGIGFHKFQNINVNLKEAVAGIGCCVSLNKSCHIFIMSTDSEKLQEALDELGITKDERSAKDVSLVAMYPAHIEEVKEDPNAKKIYWVMDEDKERAEMLYGLSLKSFSNMHVVGEAERFTALELKLILRGKKWKREDIEDVDIDTEHPDNKIPF